MIPSIIGDAITDLANEARVTLNLRYRSEINFEKRAKGIKTIATKLDEIGYPYVGHLRLHRYIKLPPENDHTPKLTAIFETSEEVTPGDLDRREGGKYVPYIFEVCSPTPVPENLGDYFKVRKVEDSGPIGYGIPGDVYYWNTELKKISLGSHFEKDIQRFDETFKGTNEILKQSEVYSDLVSVF